MPGNSKPSAKSILVDSKIVTDPKTVANVFNGYFTSIGLTLAGSLPPAAPFTPYPLLNIPAFNLPTVTSEYIEKQLQNMPENKAVGLDRLPGKLIRATAPATSNSLTFILNFSLQSGKYFSERKHATVLPLCRSGSLMETNNYRPLYILPILSKLQKRYVHT